jgi:hypothetical protein
MAVDNKALAGIIRVEVAKITSAMNKLSSKVDAIIQVAELREKHEEPKSEQRGSHGYGDSTQSSMSGIVPSPTSSNKPKNSTYSHNPRRRARRTWRFFKRIFLKRDYLERLAFIAGITYAVVTVFQWHDANRNFVIEERAWLSLVGISQPELKDGKAVTSVSKVVIGNTGKTPAKSVYIYCGMKIMRSSSPADISYSQQYEINFSGLLNPGQSIPVVVQKVPGTDEPSQPLVISDAEAEDLQYGRRYVITYCKGTFNDIFEKPHWFRTCTAMTYREPGNYRYRDCIKYDNTGDGRLPPDTEK